MKTIGIEDTLTALNRAGLSLSTKTVSTVAKDGAASTDKGVSDTITLSAHAKSMLQQAKDGQVASKMLATAFRGKGGTRWEESAQNLSQSTSSDGTSRLLSDLQQYKLTDIEKYFDLTTGARLGRVPGAVVPKDEVSSLYAVNEHGENSILSMWNMMSEGEDKDALLSAYNTRTLNIQYTENVPGLDYKLNATVSHSESGTGQEIRPTYNRGALPEKNWIIGWNETLGGYVITW